nr:NBS-LRR disease resistance protein [Dasypyrum villosum]
MAASAALVFAGKSVAVPAISFLINKAFSYINEYCRSEDMDEVKNRLLLALPQIKAVFDVVNPECVREQSSALDAWLWQLRDAVEAAEDAIDELEYYELEAKANDRKVSEWGSPFGKMKHNLVRSVKSVPVFNKTLKKIAHVAAAGVVSFLNLTDYLTGGSTSTSSQQQPHKAVSNDHQTGSTLSATIFVGREKEKEQIIGWLANMSVQLAGTGVTRATTSIPIISVVGHGGMGKTTLAQSICEQEEILKHFKVIWITVSTNFDATSVTRNILECATGTKPSADHLEPLQRDLKKKLKSIKFLLVLDDVWEDKKIDEWEKLFAPLRKEHTVGSKIMLTTRMQSVADMAAKVMGVKRDHCLILQGLQEDENSELFFHHAFAGLNPENYVDLKSIGGRIARKLRGCPLVTKVVGDHLQGNLAVEYWSSFLHQRLEHFKGTEEDIMKVLRLSYYHLRTELQICFRYCCIFPQDYKFLKKELVQLWIGSGLISQPANDTQTLEDTAQLFLAQLTRKSFFDLKSGAGRSNQDCYVLHDLMHDLARNVSSGECARIDDPVQLKDEKDTVQHLCIVNIHSFTAYEFNNFFHFKNMRTIIIHNSHEVENDFFLEKDEVENDVVCALEMIVGSSKSLRLFHSNLRNTFHVADKFGTIRRVAKFYHLMVLRCGFDGLETETYEARYLGNLERLRYVSYGVHGFGNFPISRLTFLQELHDYRVGGKMCTQVSAVGSLRDHRELHVQGLENVENCEEAKNAKLKYKQHLNNLCLEWSRVDQIMTDDLFEWSRADEIMTYDLAECSIYDQIVMDDEFVLNYLEPHVNIRVLQIAGCKGSKVPFWIENRSLKNLTSLKLISCINWDYLPSLGELVLLKLLNLENLPKLQQIGRLSDMSRSQSMELLLPQSLDTLEVTKCQKLRELPILPPSLVSLVIRDVWLTKLPMIGKVSGESIDSKSSKLLYLSITSCPHLTSLEGSLLEQKQYIGAIRSLTVDNCKHLETAAIPFEEMKELKGLNIIECPMLRATRDGKDKLLTSSLRELTIARCGDLELALLGSIQPLTNLHFLKLQNCPGLVSLPSMVVFKSLKSLRHMYIEGCQNLSSLGGLGSLSTLSWLSILRCIKLTKAVGWTSSVTRVASGSRSADNEERLVEMESGSSLQIRSLKIDLQSLLLKSEMESIPEQWLLQNRTSLQLLTTHVVDSLKSLPPSMQDLCSLEQLCLIGARQLQSLPCLPSSLKWLALSECRHPDLEKKITEYGSPEWNKIARIPYAQIGTSTLPLSSSLA